MVPDMADFSGQVYKKATNIDDLNATVNAHYHYSDDKIVIYFGFLVSDIAEAAEGCRRVIKTYRSFLVKDVTDSFEHFGLDGSPKPDDLTSNLVRRTFVNCTVTNVPSMTGVVELSSNLASDQITLVYGGDE